MIIYRETTKTNDSLLAIEIVAVIIFFTVELTFNKSFRDIRLFDIRLPEPEPFLINNNNYSTLKFNYYGIKYNYFAEVFKYFSIKIGNKYVFDNFS